MDELYLWDIPWGISHFSVYLLKIGVLSENNKDIEDILGADDGGAHFLHMTLQKWR